MPTRSAHSHTATRPSPSLFSTRHCNPLPIQRSAAFAALCSSFPHVPSLQSAWTPSIVASTTVCVHLHLCSSTAGRQGALALHLPVAENLHRAPPPLLCLTCAVVHATCRLQLLLRGGGAAVAAAAVIVAAIIVLVAVIAVGGGEGVVYAAAVGTIRGSKGRATRRPQLPSAGGTCAGSGRARDPCAAIASSSCPCCACTCAGNGIQLHHTCHSRGPKRSANRW